MTGRNLLNRIERIERTRHRPTDFGARIFLIWRSAGETEKRALKAAKDCVLGPGEMVYCAPWPDAESQAPAPRWVSCAEEIGDPELTFFIDWLRAKIETRERKCPEPV